MGESRRSPLNLSSLLAAVEAAAPVAAADFLAEALAESIDAREVSFLIADFKQFTLAAWLQPAGEIGGDTFDFSLERDALHVSMTDAMGHRWMPPCWRPCWWEAATG